MPLALASRRGADLNCRLAVKGIQYASSFAGALPLGGAGTAAGWWSLCISVPPGALAGVVSESRSLEEVLDLSDFHIRKRKSHDAGSSIAAMPHNFSSWRM